MYTGVNNVRECSTSGLWIILADRLLISPNTCIETKVTTISCRPKVDRSLELDAKKASTCHSLSRRCVFTQQCDQSNVYRDPPRSRYTCRKLAKGIRPVHTR
jgi:hypothetical protein